MMKIESGRRPATILIVEDVGSIRSGMKRSVERYGYRAVVAEDDAEAPRQAILEYAVEYCAQVSQRAACAVLHRMEQRLAVWLLLLSDRLGADEIQITHERMAQHLGVRRAGVTEVACEFKYRGLISYTRGNLRVLDRRALEAVACECYGVLNLTGLRPSFA